MGSGYGYDHSKICLYKQKYNIYVSILVTWSYTYFGMPLCDKSEQVSQLIMLPFPAADSSSSPTSQFSPMSIDASVASNSLYDYSLMSVDSVRNNSMMSIDYSLMSIDTKTSMMSIDRPLYESVKSSDTPAPSNYDTHGIFEDHPGLNLSSECIVELQPYICDKLGELMTNKSAQDVLIAAEALHVESNDKEAAAEGTLGFL